MNLGVAQFSVQHFEASVWGRSKKYAGLESTVGYVGQEHTQLVT